MDRQLPGYSHPESRWEAACPSEHIGETAEVFSHRIVRAILAICLAIRVSPGGLQHAGIRQSDSDREFVFCPPIYDDFFYYP